MTRLSLPASFGTRMCTLLGEEEYAAFLASYDREPQKGLRVNPYKTTREAFLAHTDLPLRPIPYEENGFYLDTAGSGIGNTPAHHAGMIYLQEPAAMLPVAAAPIRRGDYVLDVCAAPGGKSTQLAAAVGREGLICANEFVSSRAGILASNIERLGIPNAIVTNTDAAHLRSMYAGCFDCVVVDAPCSGEGMFRKNPLAISEWSEANVAMCASRSYDILEEASHCLRDGGVLVYSTCTFSMEENEGLIARFLSAHPGYTILALPYAVKAMTTPGYQVEGCPISLSETARCYPHVTGGEGQFVCVMRKPGDGVRAPISDQTKPVTCKEAAPVNALLQELFSDPENRQVRVLGGVYALVPDHMAVAGKCFSFGVPLGELRGTRIHPHHHLFSAYGAEMRRKWNFSAADPRILRYLHGDTVEITEKDCIGEEGDGFGAVLVDGCPLGGAKRVGNTLKNHYPKGLRIPNI